MKKTITILAVLMLAVCFNNAQAQKTKKPGKKQLLIENQALKSQLDSLLQMIDSLKEKQYLEDSEVLAVMEGNSESQAIEYTTEVSDSLLHLWYKNSNLGDFDTVNQYNMDSVSLSSNVSEEEIISRLDAMNSFIKLPFNENVKNYIVLYSEKLNSKMSRVLGMSNYYFPIFEEILARYDLPMELKYMAIIESMLNPTATSRAGARGIWQFMYTTGKAYGLEINSFVDERLDAVSAMDAAARYLRDSYKVFGDWTLAISSYNCGAGNVSKAIRRAGGKRDFWSIYPYLPRETRGYVPAFVGAMYAMTYYREYGITPMNVGMPAQTDTFEIRKNLHFTQINEIVGIPMEDLTNLNPQYIHNVIPGKDHMYILKVPYNWTAQFIEADKDTLYKHKADSLFNNGIVKRMAANSKSGSGQAVTYRVKSGDYLGKIASRYGVTVNQLKNWNNLRSNNLRIGQILYIYGGRNVSAQTSAKSSSSAPAAKTSGSAGSTSSAKTVTPPAGSRVYTVKAGDSLYLIAKKYPGVSAEDIKAANKLGSSSIRPGQTLVIPNP